MKSNKTAPSTKWKRKPDFAQINLAKKSVDAKEEARKNGLIQHLTDLEMKPSLKTRK